MAILCHADTVQTLWGSYSQPASGYVGMWGGGLCPLPICHFLPVITISISYLPTQGRTSVCLDPVWNETKRKGMGWDGGHLVYPIVEYFWMGRSGERILYSSISTPCCQHHWGGKECRARACVHVFRITIHIGFSPRRALYLHYALARPPFLLARPDRRSEAE